MMNTLLFVYSGSTNPLFIYMYLTDGCYDVTDEREWSTPNYPFDYLEDSDICWTITAPIDHQVQECSEMSSMELFVKLACMGITMN